MSDHHFPSLDELIRQVEAESATRPDLPQLLASVIRMMVASEADPNLLVGVLIEGLAHAIGARIPAERRQEVGRETLALLRDRLQAHGLL